MSTTELNNKYVDIEILNSGNRMYRFTVLNNQLIIRKIEFIDGKNIHKTLLKYNDNIHSWLGVVDGKLIKIPSPSLRDLLIQIGELSE